MKYDRWYITLRVGVHLLKPTQVGYHSHDLWLIIPDGFVAEPTRLEKCFAAS